MLASCFPVRGCAAGPGSAQPPSCATCHRNHPPYTYQAIPSQGSAPPNPPYQPIPQLVDKHKPTPYYTHFVQLTNDTLLTPYCTGHFDPTTCTLLQGLLYCCFCAERALKFNLVFSNTVMLLELLCWRLRQSVHFARRD